MAETLKSDPTTLRSVLAQHFNRDDLHELNSAGRTFPSTARLDLILAISQVCSGDITPIRQLGFVRAFGFTTLNFADMVTESDSPIRVAPLLYEDVDVGEAVPVRAVKHCVWLGKAQNGLLFALLLTTALAGRDETGWSVEFACFPSEEGQALSQRVLSGIEREVAKAGSYRGKVVSLEQGGRFGGEAGAVRVHRLRSVGREEVILPGKTLQLLERNVIRFVGQREKLAAAGLGLKKGLLFYGPPGTGKTHTIHFLAGLLPNHTTFLVTAEQVALLPRYMQWARFLQPSIVVLEDVDLVARSRGSKGSVCEEVALNQLLNEMDGMREDSRIIFILTTNRPEEMEGALSARPGRIDQAIEFPLPDAEGRRRLIELYRGRLRISGEVTELLVQRCRGGSGAFIKELMRRTAQYAFDQNQDELSQSHVEAALDEILFSGGSLNAKLLGFHQPQELAA